jgi:cytochrome c-type biogenesis protein CcmH/NrfF
LLGSLALLATGLPGASAQTASPPPVSSVSDKLMCLCGCNSVLTQCPHQNCEWGIPAKERIKQELADGKKPDAIIKEFVDQYGERVLAAPTKSGFNLLAWVIPFVVLIGGAIGLYFVVAGWSKRRSRAALATPSGQIEQPEAVASDELVKKMEDELKDFD